MKCLIALFIITINCYIPIHAQFIPTPKSIKMNKGSFVLDRSVGILFDREHSMEGSALAKYLSTRIEGETGVYISPKNRGKKNIVFKLLEEPKIELGEEGYLFNVSSSKICITANSRKGLFYGAQSLLQYIITYNTKTPIELPNLEIMDVPKMKWRGMMLDVSRHFFSVGTIKEMLDLMAYYKLNVFHWHLSDNEGWRLEIRKYPKLTGIGSWRKEVPGSVFYKQDSTYIRKLDDKPYSYGGYYTQKQIKEVVTYAKERNITVVPEIDLPGHSGAALTAYPGFSCGKHQQESPNSALWNGVVDTKNSNLNFCPGQESTFEFIENILMEVMELFPSKYIHIGGDEVDTGYWENCKNCQRRMVVEGLKEERGLQGYFLKRIAKFLQNHGRVPLGWDEILEGGVPPNTIVMSWRGERGGVTAAKMGKKVIMAPSDPFYFNRYQGNPEHQPLAGAFSINTLKRVYDYEIVPKVLDVDQKGLVMGAEFAIWTEFISSVEHLEYMLLPRMPAFAENVWSIPRNKDFNDFVSRLNRGHYDFWKDQGIRFYPEYYIKSIY